MSEKQLVDDLPPSTDKFWDHAEVTSHHISFKECEHDMVRKNGIEAECKHCHIGFMLHPRCDVREGHIYIGETLVV